MFDQFFHRICKLGNTRTQTLKLIDLRLQYAGWISDIESLVIVKIHAHNLAR